jgi:hypothetical protein
MVDCAAFQDTGSNDLRVAGFAPALIAKAEPAADGAEPAASASWYRSSTRASAARRARARSSHPSESRSD